MSALPRTRCWIASLALVASAVGLVSLGYAENPAGAAKQPKWYVRPVVTDPSSRRAMDDAGIEWVEFEYCLPGDCMATFAFVAKDEKGQIISSMSEVSELLTTQDALRGFARLTRIDSSRATEDSKGRIGWVRSVGGLRSETSWQDKGAGSRPAWRDGKLAQRPELDVEYPLWETWTHSPDVKEIHPDSPRAFEFKLSFRIEKIAPAERRNSTRWRAVESPQKK